MLFYVPCAKNTRGMKMTPVRMREKLSRLIEKKYGSQMAAARAWGYTQSYVSAVVVGRRTPSQVILAELGLRKITTVMYK